MTHAVKMCVSEELLPRCGHSVYFPKQFSDKGQPNFGCGFCNPDAYSDVLHTAKKSVKRFVMPNCGRAIYEQENEFRSNKHTPDACKACGCNMHYVEDDGRWRCADCGEVWRGKVR